MVALLVLINKMEGVPRARVAAILVRVPSGQAASKDTVLGVEDGHVRMDNGLQSILLPRRKRSSEGTQLVGVQVEGGRSRMGVFIAC